MQVLIKQPIKTLNSVKRHATETENKPPQTHTDRPRETEVASVSASGCQRLICTEASNICLDLCVCVTECLFTSSHPSNQGPGEGGRRGRWWRSSRRLLPLSRRSTRPRRPGPGGRLGLGRTKLLPQSLTNLEQGQSRVQREREL